MGLHQGFAIFVPLTAPGDTVQVEITSVTKSFGRASLLGIISPSPQRVSPQCRHFGICAGCQLQHLDYPAQVAIKTQMVKDTLERIGKLTEVEVLDTIPMDDPWYYRNKAEYTAHVDGDHLVLGFHRMERGPVLSLEECPLQHPLSIEIKQAVENDFGRLGSLPVIKLITRIAFANGDALTTLISRDQSPQLNDLAKSLVHRFPQMKGVVTWVAKGKSGKRLVSRQLAAGGQGYLTERVAGWDFRVSAESFFQVNPASAERLLTLLLEWADLGGQELIIDAYCGVGIFLLPLCARAKLGWGIEEDAFSYRDARSNVKRHRRSNCRLLQGKVERLLPKLLAREGKADLIVFDPPRRGCGRAALEAAAAMAPRTILMVSCHPGTLARDLRYLAELGYRTVRVQPIDMFPQTAHVECLALCSRER